MKLLHFPLLLLLTFSCFAQDKKALEERAMKWYTYYASEKYDSLVNYIHPGVFKYESQKDYIKSLRNTTSEKVSISPVHTPPNFYFGEIKKVGENYYCILYHDQTMKAKFYDEISKQSSDFLIEYVKKRFQADKVIFNERMNAIFLLTRMRAIAIADKTNDFAWTFEPIINVRAIREQLGL